MRNVILTGISLDAPVRSIPGYTPRISVEKLQRKLDGVFEQIQERLPDHSFEGSFIVVQMDTWAADLAVDTLNRIILDSRVSPLDLAASVPNSLISRIVRPHGFRGGIASISADISVLERRTWVHPIFTPFQNNDALAVDIRSEIGETAWSYKFGAPAEGDSD